MTVFHVATSRSGAAAKALLGADFVGLLTTDRWSACSWVPLDQRQVCWSHLARDWQGLADRGGTAGPLGRRGVALTRDLFREWHRFRRGELDRAGQQAALGSVQDDFEELLDDGMRCADAKAPGLCRALDRLWPALWTFADEDGAHFVERLLTVVAACQQQSRDVLAYLVATRTAALHGHPAPSLLGAAA